jgi:ferredoxin-NADP reductase
VAVSVVLAASDTTDREDGSPVVPELLRVTQVTLESEGVISIRLEHPRGLFLPRTLPGAHLEIQLPSGLTRQYSLCGDPDDSSAYTIAVLLEAAGRGGSRELHSLPLIGRTLRVRALRNHFPLVDAPSYLLIAGGIGVTPMLAMVGELARGDKPWSLLYLGRSRKTMPFLDLLAQVGADHVRVVSKDQSKRLNVARVISRSPVDTVVYCCGPDELMSEVQQVCHGLTPPRDVYIERFAATKGNPLKSDVPLGQFTVVLRKRGTEIVVPPDRSILDVVRDVDSSVPFSCEEGFCGSCETRVLEGVPAHADDVLSPDERVRGDTMMICVSRAASDRLVLDL